MTMITMTMTTPTHTQAPTTTVNLKVQPPDLESPSFWLSLFQSLSASCFAASVAIAINNNRKPNKLLMLLP